MSRQIDMSDPDAWTEDDVRYLQDRDQLPDDYKGYLPPPQVAGVPPLGENTGTVNANPVRDGDKAVFEGTREEEYRNMTTTQLKDELRSRGIPSTGNKQELVYRLLADDASGDEF